MFISAIKRFFRELTKTPIFNTNAEKEGLDSFFIQRNILIFNFVGKFLFFVFIFYGLFSIFNKQYIIGIVDLAAALFLSLVLFYLKRTQNYNFASKIILYIMLIMTIYFFQLGEAGNGLYLWSLTAPTFLIFFLKLNEGIILSLAYLIINLILAFLNVFNSEYSGKVLLRYSGVYISIVIMAYIYGKVQERSNVELKSINLILEQSESKYRALVENGNDGIAILRELRFIYINSKLLKILGYSNPDILERSLIDLIPAEEQEALLQMFDNRTVKSKYPQTLDVSLLDKNGEHIDVEINVSTIDYEGIPSDLIFVREIGERKKLELEKLKYSKLESLQMVANGVTHDFNNILTIIMGNLELMKSNFKENDKLKKPLNKIEESAGRASRLLSELHLFSSNAVKDVRNEEMGEIMDSVIIQLKKEFKTSIDLKINNNIWNLRCDREQIQIAIRNIILNSIDVSEDEGLIDILIENYTNYPMAIHSLKEEKYLWILIQDYGEGIPRENIDKIFDPYFSTKEDITKKGVGLGLSIANKIILDHNGLIRVDSKKGKGTTFNIFLPAAKN
ncbi:MAG: ATP-binding protein [Acidobacteriota bacterium]